MAESNPNSGQKNPTAPPVASDVVVTALNALTAQQKLFADQLTRSYDDQAKGAKRRFIIQLVMFGFPIIMTLVYLLIAAVYSAGNLMGPFKDVVAVVRIEGAIGADQVASADKLVPALKKAFEEKRVKAVILSIDSPGGTPVESNRINDALAILKKQHPDKSVIAVANNQTASAAYMIAMHADKIVASQYSLVGSIGAVIKGYDVHKLAKRLEVDQRVFASGAYKDLLNPLRDMTPDAGARVQSLVDGLGVRFADEFKRQRGSKLKTGINYFTGEVWSGAQALELGLVDQLGTIETVLNEKWPDLIIRDYSPSHQSWGLLGMSNSIKTMIADRLVSAVLPLNSEGVVAN